MDSLEHRLKRLMLFRVVMITTLLLVAVYVEAVSETLLPGVNPLYLLVAATYALTILYAVALRTIPYWEPQVYIQVVLDLLIVTGLVYLTPQTGTRVGFMLLYPIAVLSGSVLLYRRKGLILAGLATLCYAAVVLAVRLKMIPTQGLADMTEMPVKQLAYSIFVTGVACTTVALIGSYFSESLRNVGEKLEEAAEQVADLQKLNQVIVASIQSGLLTADAGGRILYVNEVGQAILGQRGHELRGRTLKDVFDSMLLDANALQARATRAGLARLEVPFKTRDGGHVGLGISVSPLATGEPKGRGYLLVFQDLTEIKRLEEEVRIKEKLAAVGEMAAKLAHEIRNPLGSISGSAQVLMAEPNMSSEQERLLAIITRESRRLSETLNQFLFQARPMSRQGPIDIGHVVGEALTLLRNGPEVRGAHEVQFDMDEGPHVCLGDPDQITQIFWNLARNGLEAMPHGGVLQVRVFSSGEEVVLSIRDQGRGMAREEQRQLFQPFHTQTPVGTGLGLAIVYHIVREHRGDITVRSVPAEGTEVQVRLPMVSVPISA